MCTVCNQLEYTSITISNLNPKERALIIYEGLIYIILYDIKIVQMNFCLGRINGGHVYIPV